MSERHRHHHALHSRSSIQFSSQWYPSKRQELFSSHAYYSSCGFSLWYLILCHLIGNTHPVPSSSSSPSPSSFPQIFTPIRIHLYTLLSTSPEPQSSIPPPTLLTRESQNPSTTQPYLIYPPAGNKSFRPPIHSFGYINAIEYHASVELCHTRCFLPSEPPSLT